MSLPRKIVAPANARLRKYDRSTPIGRSSSPSQLFNWGTRFDILSAESTRGDWTFAAEYGWGPTFLVVEGQRFTNDIAAAYALASRLLPRGRATLRVDGFEVDDNRDYAVTLAYFWTGIRKTRIGVEVTKSEQSRRVLIEARYAF